MKALMDDLTFTIDSSWKILQGIDCLMGKHEVQSWNINVAGAEER